VRDLAEKDEWALISADVADPARGVPEETVWRAVRGVMFHYNKDVLTGQEFYFLSGWRAERVEECAREVDARMEPYGIGELLAVTRAEQVPAERGRGLIRLGLAAPYGFDQDVFEEISRALQDEDPNIRNVAIFACGFSPWQQYREILDRVHRDDPAPELRQSAGAALRAFGSGGNPS